MKTYLLNYADDRHKHREGQFRVNQLTLNKSAIERGINNIVSWTWEDMITRKFYHDHKEFLDKDRFHNGNVFKPYIILELLERIDPGDILFYHDCSSITFNRPLEPLIHLCKKNNGTLFHRYFGDKNRNWTKRDAFFYMDCDSPRYHNAVALQNTWLLMEKNEFAIQFVQEWLKFNLDERIASYVKPDTCGLSPLNGFIENRGDQSIFSNLAEKYGIKSYYGAGGSKNRNVNHFIDSMHKTSLRVVVGTIRRLRAHLIRKKLLRKLALATAQKAKVGSVH